MAEKFDVVLTDDQAEVKSVKYGEKEYTPEEFERIIDRDKNLQADYTKKTQELAEKQKTLDAQFAGYKNIDDTLAKFPEAKKEIEAIVEKVRTGKMTKTEGNEAVAEVKKELDEVKAQLAEEKRIAALEGHVNAYKAKISKELDELGVKSGRIKQSIETDAFNFLMTQKEAPKDEDLKKHIKELVDEAKAEFGGKAPVTEPEKGKKFPQQIKVPGKGGQSGGKDQMPPKPGTQEWNDKKEKAKQNYLNSLNGG